ncbi:hypothetical protein R1flu_005821 [Riccia fluitans]|uniref:Uncharacterized protein n=1 Tax=Riccia fluitans TaxID=41844 RepID=A0ABD1YY93_9MARC
MQGVRDGVAGLHAPEVGFLRNGLGLSDTTSPSAGGWASVKTKIQFVFRELPSQESSTMNGRSLTLKPEGFRSVRGNLEPLFIESPGPV